MPAYAPVDRPPSLDADVVGPVGDAVGAEVDIIVPETAVVEPEGEFSPTVVAARWDTSKDH